MKTIAESINTPIVSKCEVLVAGGGFAGIAAALAAARGGATVLLLEREFILGGLGTAGLVTIYLPLCDGMGNQVTYGIAEELLKLSIRHWAEALYPAAWLGEGTPQERAKARYQVQYNPHMFALEAEKLLAENGVKILYGTAAVAVSQSGGKIDAVIIENKSGRGAIEISKSVVDCTGDADICKFAGEKTVNFAQGNINASWHYFFAQGKLNLKMQGACDTPDKYKGDGEKSAVKRYAGLDAEEISGFVMDSHRALREDILRRRETDTSHVPVTIATIPQLRMTRRLEGAYTMDDTEMGRDYADSVGMFGNWRRNGPVYRLPFSTLYGNRVRNLAVAGRCISVTEAMWDITRVIPVCALSGQAAGRAAAMGCDFAGLDIRKLQAVLVGDGVRI